MSKHRGMLGHVRGLVGNVMDARSPEAVRASHARSAAETLADLRDAAVAGELTLRVGRVSDWMDPSPEARDRDLQRDQLAELRDLVHLPGLLPTNVLNDGESGYGPTPLIREAAEEWTASLLGARAIVPGLPSGGPYAEVDPDLDGTEGASIEITDIADEDGRHWSVLTASSSKQFTDWLSEDGRRLMDRVVFDEVDLRAEEFVATALIAAAGDTRAAGADLAAALDEAEGAAGARGVPRWLVVSPLDWPAVRRSLPATWFDGPAPLALVSAGQPAGTATIVGQGAVILLANDYISGETVRPRNLSRDVGIARPFYLAVRDEDGIQTVTGIGA